MDSRELSPSRSGAAIDVFRRLLDGVPMTEADRETLSVLGAVEVTADGRQVLIVQADVTAWLESRTPRWNVRPPRSQIVSRAVWRPLNGWNFCSKRVDGSRMTMPVSSRRWAWARLDMA
jgi:hypothetical protein